MWAAFAASILASAALVACGGDDGNNDTPDAAPAPDADPTACNTTLALGDLDVLNIPGDGTFTSWAFPVTDDLGTGGDVKLQVEFYSGIETSLVGTWDLAAGNQANYKTCAACFHLVAFAADGSVAKHYFQSGGSLTLSEDPLTGTLSGTVTDLKLIEVTVDPNNGYQSTPVDGGACSQHASLALDHGAAPNAWTCAANAYNDGANCDCACGVEDPDCANVADAPVVGCTGAQVCVTGVCTDTCTVLGTPAGCTTGTCGFQTADQDICYTDTTVVDATAGLGDTCAAGPTFCAVSNTIATGLCDNFVANDQVCRKACDSNDDCTGTDVCHAIVGAKGLCITPPANDTCQTAPALTIGTPADGTTVGASSNYSAGLEGAACTGFSQPGGDVAYSVALTNGQAITVTLSNVGASFDPSISILGPGTAAAVCDANPVVCLKGADAGFSGDNETFQYTATADGTYYILVDTYSASGSGTFTLTVTSP